MKLSSQSNYGLKGCYILAQNYNSEPIPSSKLEEKIGVSKKYLERIMRTLSNAKIVKASRGTLGGYSLSKNPKETTIGEIVRALEDNMEFIGCVLHKDCNCPSGNVWRKLYKGMT